MSQRSATRRALSAAEVLALPAMVDGYPDAANACGGIGRTAWYELVTRDETPVPIVRIGRQIKVRRSDLLAFLGLEDTEAAAGATATASNEHITPAA